MSDTPMTDDDFSDLVEECNSPAAKRIEQLERELAEARAQRDALVEALDGLMDEYTDRKAQWGSEYLWEKHECAEVIETAREALAAVKGEKS